MSLTTVHKLELIFVEGAYISKLVEFVHQLHKKSMTKPHFLEDN